MRNLLGIAFALTLAAACGKTPDQITADECQADPTLPQCQGVICADHSECAALDDGECVVGRCVDGVCEATPCDDEEILGSGDAVVFANANGSAFFGTVFDDSPGMDDYLDLEQEELDAAVVGSCIERPQPGDFGEPANKSIGTVRLIKEGATLVELEPGDSLRYEEVLDAGLIGPNDFLDFEIEGDGAVDPTTLVGFLNIPPSPVLTGLTNNTLAFSDTITFETIEVDRLHFLFSFIDPNTNQGVSLLCAADGQSGSFTLDAATLGRLPTDGAVTVLAFNRKVRLIQTNDGSVRAIRGLAQSSTSASYTIQ